MKPPTFTITAVSGAFVPEMNAGGSLEPLPDGSYVTTSPGAKTTAEGDKRPHLRLVT